MWLYNAIGYILTSVNGHQLYEERSWHWQDKIRRTLRYPIVQNVSAWFSEQWGP